MPINTQIDLLKERRTKIVATVGPSSQDPVTLRDLIQVGVNVFRLNMSHGDHDFHSKVFQAIRSVSKELNEPIAVLTDLCSPKIRTDKFKEQKISLQQGTVWWP